VDECKPLAGGAPIRVSRRVAAVAMLYGDRCKAGRYLMLTECAKCLDNQSDSEVLSLT
jgi:hypothetical protein